MALNDTKILGGRAMEVPFKVSSWGRIYFTNLSKTNIPEFEWLKKILNIRARDFLNLERLRLYWFFDESEDAATNVLQISKKFEI